MEEKTRLKETDKNNIEPKVLPNFIYAIGTAEQEAMSWFPDRDAWRLRFNYTLWHFFKSNPKALTIQDFCDATNYNYYTVHRYFREHKDIKECWERVKLMLGNRRYKGFVGATDDFKNGNNLWKDIHLFGEDYHKINQYHQNLKIEENAKNVDQIVKVTKRLVDYERERETTLVIIENTEKV